MTNWLTLAVNVAVSFFLAPFVVQKLGSIYYGIWVLTMQFTGYLYLLDFGVRESVVRYTSKYAARKQGRQLNRVLTTAFVVYLPIFVLCLVATAVGMWGVTQWFNIDAVHAHDARIAVLFTGLTIAQTFVFNVFNGVQLGLRQFSAANLVNIALTLVRTAVVVFALNRGGGLTALAAIQFGAAVCAGLVSMTMALHLLRRNGIGFALEFSVGKRFTALSRRIVGYGWWVLVNNLGQKIIFTSDAIIIGIFLPIASLTPYAIAGSLIEYLRMLLMSTAQVFNPIASHLFTLRQHDELGKVLIRGAKLTLLVALPIAVTYMISGSRFVSLWMGEEYAKTAGEVLLILAITQILSAPNHVAASILYGISQHRGVAIMRLVDGAISLTLNIVLIQKLGLIGVAIGTAISQVLVVLLWLPQYVCKKIGINVWVYFAGVYGRSFLAALPFVAGAWYIESVVSPQGMLQFFGAVFVNSLLYLISVYWVSLSADEKKWLRGFIARRQAA
jgi:O-antigen/teichoic acid export membrane protein